MNKIKIKWLLFAVSGLILIGAGLSVFGEALLLKYDGAGFREWFVWGTLSLVLINAGISLFGQGVVYKVKFEREKGI